MITPSDRAIRFHLLLYAKFLRTENPDNNDNYRRLQLWKFFEDSNDRPLTKFTINKWFLQEIHFAEM